MQKMGFITSSFIVVILTLLGAYIALAAILYIFQGRFLYFPDKTMGATPHDVRLPFESIYFRTSDNVELYGWFVPKPNAKGVILFCHGNAGNISHRLEYLQLFNRLGFSTFIFDYRGFGRSEGKPTEAGTYRDAQGAWSYLVDKRSVCPEEIVVYGESLGGAVAAWLAKERHPGALILASSFTSVPDVAAAIYPLFPVRWLAQFQYDTKRLLPAVACPVLVIHSSDDEIIPFAHGQDLFQEAKDPKAFLEIRGGHNTGFLESGDVYLKGISSFLSEHLPKTGP
ncbi:MAG: alpha/beta hydrolase [Syntrophobacteraceae bacterium]